MKVEVAILGSLSLIVLMVSVDVKQQGTLKVCLVHIYNGAFSALMGKKGAYLLLTAVQSKWA